MEEEPLIKRGLREARISISLRASVSRFSL
jgi:hypothetical protein